MNIPKVKFVFSSVYYEVLTGKTPKERRIINYIRKISKIWRKKEKKILTALSTLTGLKWEEKEIYCYLVDNCEPFSDPLTLPPFKNYSKFIENLIHELIHRLLMQMKNRSKTKKAWKYIFRKFRKESRRTKIHIVVIGIHLLLHKRLRVAKINRKLNFLKTHYPIAWKIVQNEPSIIDNFIRRIS